MYLPPLSNFLSTPYLDHRPREIPREAVAPLSPFMSATAFSRRRHHSHRFRFRCMITAISAVILLLFVFISLHAPSPTHTHHHQRYPLPSKLLDDVDEDSSTVFRVPVRVSGGGLGHDIWKSRLSKYYYGCSNSSKKFADAGAITKTNRYLLIATSGGLNQQRTGITDAVVAARILNATLVVPKLDQKSFWKDTSNFADIFDVDWFISHLSKDVKIIKKLPRRSGKIWVPYTMRVPRKCNTNCYQNRVLPNLLKKHAVQLTKFDYRLSNKLDVDFQKLRCRVNYHGLKFTDPITAMGEKLVHRMRLRSKHYIALHLRFEPDMLAFSGCYYGGGDKERAELGAIRKRWKTLHVSNPDKVRRQGRCPLTPEEVGLMLRALGYGQDVHIYVASGEIYGGEETLGPLKALFPNFNSKESLASKEELEKFSAFSSRMAALDFIVCDESDVFATNNNGNMAKILAGRRRYFRHKPTIRPNAKKLYRLFLSRDNMTWDAFAAGVRTHQRGFMGEPKEVRPGRGQFHENPAACICEDSEALRKSELYKKPHKENTIKEVEEVVDVQNDDDDPEWPDELDDDEDQNTLLGKEMFNMTSSDYNVISEEPELEELLSD